MKYLYEGVGLRQVMDLFFAQRVCAEGRDKVLALFKSLGLMRFVAATQWVLSEVFQMPREQLLCEPDAHEGQRLLDEILIGGNFGKHDAGEAQWFLGVGGWRLAHHSAGCEAPSLQD